MESFLVFENQSVLPILWEVSYILVISFITWKTWTVRGEGWRWSTSFEEVFWMRPLGFIALSTREIFFVTWVHSNMGTFQLIVLFIMVHHVLNRFFLTKIILVDAALGQGGLDILEFAEMSSAVTTFTNTEFWIMMFEINFSEFLGGFGKVFLFLEAEWLGIFLLPLWMEGPGKGCRLRFLEEGGRFVGFESGFHLTWTRRSGHVGKLILSETYK